MNEVPCPNCSAEIDVEESENGEIIQCPSCLSDWEVIFESEEDVRLVAPDEDDENQDEYKDIDYPDEEKDNEL